MFHQSIENPTVFPKENTAHVTVRENEIVECLCDDMSVKMIAAHLEISEFTVQDHIKNLKDKFSVHTASGLVAKFLRSQ
jgi:DNA-binding CsgD family transcriptional regulator